MTRLKLEWGIHGEKGIEVRKMMTADEVAKTLVDRITEDMPLAEGDEVSVLVNGLGATPYGRAADCVPPCP